MRPTKDQMRRTGIWLTFTQLSDLSETAQIVGSNRSQLVRDYVTAGLRRETRAQKLEAQKS